MNELLKEELQDALLELQKSKQREKKLAEENEAILAGISALRHAQNRHQIFNALMTVLQKYIPFDDGLVLSKMADEGCYRTFLCTDIAYQNSFWAINNKFTRAIKGECIVIYDPAKSELFSNQTFSVRNPINSALICGFSSEVSQSIIILTGKNKGQLNADSKSTLMRLMPLVDRALQDIEQKEKLQLLVEARTRELANNRLRFIDFAQSVGDWLWETDSTLNITYSTSSQDSAILEIKDNLLNFLAIVDEKKNSKAIIRAISKLERFNNIEVAVKGDQYINISGKPYFSSEGEYLGYRGAIKDVTNNRKQIQALKKAQKEAINASKAKSEFLAMMSHEIRTPLNTVTGLIDILKDSRSYTLEQHDILKQMELSADLLFVLISDILDLSKIESGHFKFDARSANLRDLIHNSVGHHMAQAKSKGIRITVDIAENIPQYIVIDSTRFTQILFNLVGNAVKFTSEGEVKITAEKTCENKFIIEVTDTGIGIHEKTIGKLFNAFQQADSSITREFGGTGLGLAISKRLVDFMGGTIEVESTLGEGSRFRVELPVTESTEPAKNIQTAMSECKSARGKHILLVEDNKTNQMVIKLLLNKLGYKVSIANNGAEAVTRLTNTSEQNYDLVFMDLSMPVMDGVEATSIIRADKNITVPIIALTAHAMESDEEKCMKAGMNGFLTKPIKIAELEYQMNRVFADKPASLIDN